LAWSRVDAFSGIPIRNGRVQVRLRPGTYSAIRICAFNPELLVHFSAERCAFGLDDGLCAAKGAGPKFGFHVDDLHFDPILMLRFDLQTTARPFGSFQ
jgi:hypothetical protein